MLVTETAESAQFGRILPWLYEDDGVAVTARKRVRFDNWLLWIDDLRVPAWSEHRLLLLVHNAGVEHRRRRC